MTIATTATSENSSESPRRRESGVPVTSILWLASGPIAVTGEQAIEKVVSGTHPVGDEMLWIHLDRASVDEVQQLADRFELDDDAVEDLLAEHERPKLDVGEKAIVVISRGAIFDAETGDFTSYPISAIVSSHMLVTIADAPILLQQLSQRLRKPGFAPTGAAMLYQLMDQIVDGYSKATNQIADMVDDLTERIFADHPLVRDEQLLAFRLRRSLTMLRRLITPSRDLTTSLSSMAGMALDPEADSPLTAVTRETARGFSDVADHVAHGCDAVDALREVMGSLMETNLSLADVRLNTAMKKLASWAALIAVPTLITGFMGMNVPYPGFSQTSGFIVALVVMLVAFVGLFVLFRRKDWL